MTTTSIKITLDSETMAKAEKACVLLDLKNISEYVSMLIEEDATKVITQHENMTVDADVFDQFVNSCEKVHKPNKALMDANTLTQKKAIK